MTSLFLFALVSCSDKGEFQNINDAKEYFLSQEEIYEDNIINEIYTESDYVLVFESELDGTSGYALAYFRIKQDKTVYLIGSTDKIAVDTTGDGRPVGTELVINDNETVHFSIGEYAENTFNSIERDIETGVVRIDEDRQIYYVIDVEKIY